MHAILCQPIRAAPSPAQAFAAPAAAATPVSATPALAAAPKNVVNSGLRNIAQPAGAKSWAGAARVQPQEVLADSDSIVPTSTVSTHVDYSQRNFRLLDGHDMAQKLAERRRRSEQGTF